VVNPGSELNIATTLHKLRHYSATELIRAGVDVRTVAGRLGHADGGTTLAYGGRDVVTGRDLYLKQTMPAGPDAWSTPRCW
jgi:site-specific recombinase XerD